MNKSFLESKLDWKLQFSATRRGSRTKQTNKRETFEISKRNKESVKSLHIAFPFQRIHIFHKLSSSIIRQPLLLMIPSPKVHIIYSTNFLILCMMFLLIFLLRNIFSPNMIDWIEFFPLFGDESEGNTWSFTDGIDCSIAWEEVFVPFQWEFNFPWKCFLPGMALWFFPFNYCSLA